MLTQATILLPIVITVLAMRRAFAADDESVNGIIPEIEGIFAYFVAGLVSAFAWTLWALFILSVT